MGIPSPEYREVFYINLLDLPEYYKKTNSNKQINIEGDLISSSNFPLKRARTPLNKSMQDNINKK